MNPHPNGQCRQGGTGDPRHDILSRLKGVIAGNGGSTFSALCPAHEDSKRSLSVSITDNGTVLLKCHAGCNTKAVVEAIGLTLADLFPATDTRPTGGGLGAIVKTYDYQDEVGRVLFQVVRFEPKDFRQRTPDGNGGWTWKLNGVQRVLYRLPAIVAAPPDQAVFIVEGEKDVERLDLENIVATTNAGGAGKWRPEYNQVLAGRPVVILPDNDEPGRLHAQQVAQSLLGIAASIKIVELPGLPAKGDVISSSRTKLFGAQIIWYTRRIINQVVEPGRVVTGCYVTLVSPGFFQVFSPRGESTPSGRAKRNAERPS